MNIPDDDIEHIVLTSEEARSAIDGAPSWEKIVVALDEAQAPVFAGDKTHTYVVIEIVN